MASCWCGRQCASRFVVLEVQAHGGSSSAMDSPTVTGFTGFVLSRTTDPDDAGGAVGGVAGGAAVAGGVDDGVAGVVSVEVGGVGADGPLICGVGDCGTD